MEAPRSSAENTLSVDMESPRDTTGVVFFDMSQ